MVRETSGPWLGCLHDTNRMSAPLGRENAGVNDYAKSNGTSKDRRWAEGSSLISRRKPDGELVYLLTYSANYFATAQCE